MQTLSRYRPALAGLLAVAALAAGACKRNQPPPEPIQVAQETPAPAASEAPYVVEEPARPSAPETTAPEAGNLQQPPGEVQQQPQVVVIQPEAPRAGANVPKSSAAARERELARRQAELDARERRLREEEERREAEARAEKPAEAEPAPAPEPEPEPVREEPRYVEATVPAGTDLDVEFTRSLSSATASVGDTFRVRVTDAVRAEGVVAIPAGSELVGEVTDVASLRRVGGQARLGLRFTDLVLPSGQTVPVTASFVEQGRSETRRDAATIGGAAAGGAILGRILNKGNKTKGAVSGANIGAAAGTAIASRTPGEEVTIPEGAVVSVRLDRSVDIRRRL